MRVCLLYWGGLLSSAFRLFSIDPVVMSVAGSSLLYWGGLLSSAFRLFSIDPVVMSVAGSALLFGIGTKPSHDRIRRMRRNDLSHVVAVRLAARTRDRTDSPQPSSLRGTSLHQSVELGFSPC